MYLVNWLVEHANSYMFLAMAALRILLSEGSTLSARQTVTVLGRAGYRVDLCDPDSVCLARWSRYVRNVWKCPGMGEDPKGYLAFVLELLHSARYDVFLPVHEQAYLFARFRDQLPNEVACALAPFAAFEQVQSKVAFSRLLTHLGLPQPETSVVTSQDAFLRASFPAYVKTAFGTASGGVWRVDSATTAAPLAAQFSADEVWQEGVVVQHPETGALERAQSLFDQGRLVAWHAYRQERAGPGGGDVVKVSCPRAIIGEHLARMGEALLWHGAFSLDYLWQEEAQRPLYFDANPRLVEPVNALLSGTDLPGLWLRLALGERVDALPPGRSGVRTRMSLMGMMQACAEQPSRRALAAEAARILFRRGAYAATREELTPLLEDPWSIVPLSVVTATLLADPFGIAGLRARAASRHTLSPRAVRFIHKGS